MLISSMRRNEGFFACRRKRCLLPLRAENHQRKDPQTLNSRPLPCATVGISSNLHSCQQTPPSPVHRRSVSSCQANQPPRSQSFGPHRQEAPPPRALRQEAISLAQRGEGVANTPTCSKDTPPILGDTELSFRGIR